MPQSLSAVYVHLVFSTRDRIPFLGEAEILSDTHRYIAGVSKSLDCPALIVGGVGDHVHILSRLGRGTTQSGYVKELKRVSSAWAKERCGPEFAWQSGFGIFSVGSEQLSAVEVYIANQEEHHKRFTFQDEYRRLMSEHAVEWDETYVWG